MLGAPLHAELWVGHRALRNYKRP